MVHDALPVLAAGLPEGWGVALISGTGSLCFGQRADGRAARSGGWGYLFGDEGSGHAIAVAGLRAVAMAADGRGRETKLRQAFLTRLNLDKPEELVSAVYPKASDRASVAALASVVTATAAEEDEIAGRILDQAAEDLAAMVAGVTRSLDFSASPFPLSLAGGVLLGSEDMITRLATRLGSLGLCAEPVACVDEPVCGAVRLAQRDAAD